MCKTYAQRFNSPKRVLKFDGKFRKAHVFVILMHFKTPAYPLLLQVGQHCRHVENGSTHTRRAAVFIVMINHII